MQNRHNKFLVLGLIALAFFILPCVNAQQGYDRLEHPISTSSDLNQSILNVNNSQYLEGHPASYFYPNSNPNSYCNSTNGLCSFGGGNIFDQWLNKSDNATFKNLLINGTLRNVELAPVSLPAFGTTDTDNGAFDYDDGYDYQYKIYSCNYLGGVYTISSSGTESDSIDDSDFSDPFYITLGGWSSTGNCYMLFRSVVDDDNPAVYDEYRIKTTNSAFNDGYQTTGGWFSGTPSQFGTSFYDGNLTVFGNTFIKNGTLSVDTINPNTNLSVLGNILTNFALSVAGEITGRSYLNLYGTENIRMNPNTGQIIVGTTTFPTYYGAPTLYFTTRSAKPINLVLETYSNGDYTTYKTATTAQYASSQEGLFGSAGSGGTQGNIGGNIAYIGSTIPNGLLIYAGQDYTTTGKDGLPIHFKTKAWHTNYATSIDNMQVAPSGNILINNNTDNGIDQLQVTGNVSVSNLIKLKAITLPACGSGTNGSIARNSTKLYFCDGSTWNALY